LDRTNCFPEGKKCERDLCKGRKREKKRKMVEEGRDLWPISVPLRPNTIIAGFLPCPLCSRSNPTNSLKKVNELKILFVVILLLLLLYYYYYYLEMYLIKLK
jgi:hypothetical protein